MDILKITPENRAQYENTAVAFAGRIELAPRMGLLSFVSISATLSIVAEAGTGIEAGWGIKAKTLTVALRIFAGLCICRIPDASEMEIRAKVLSGTVCYGTVVEPVEQHQAEAPEAGVIPSN